MGDRIFSSLPHVRTQKMIAGVFDQRCARKEGGF